MDYLSHAGGVNVMFLIGPPLRLFKTAARSPAFSEKPGFFNRSSELLRTMAFAGVVLYLAAMSGCAPTGSEEDHGRPVEQVAKDLGVTPEQFREAFKKVKPAPRGEQPTEAQREANRRVLSQELGVSPEKLDAVMDKYRPWDPKVKVAIFLGILLAVVVVLQRVCKARSKSYADCVRGER